MVNWSEVAAKTVVEPGQKVTLPDDFDAARHDRQLGKAGGLAAIEHAKETLFDLQDRFFAAADRSLLIVLQAIDAAGKDSTIKHVMSGVNPEGVDIYSFKAPSPTERAHDYLWRHQLVLPELGRIAVFNRSHYENVTVTRVHPEMLWPKSAVLNNDGLWHRRYKHINEWERHLTDNGTTVVKLFLNVSKTEQGRRFLERIDRPEKNWKFSPTDLTERGYWDDYQHAFSEMLSHTSTDHAPWHVIPADHKWYSHLCSLAVIVHELEKLDPQYPDVAADVKAHLADAKKALLADPSMSDSTVSDSTVSDSTLPDSSDTGTSK
jgi:PPK2 family polyphosphate:nucleotide phosphotransferase